MDRTRVAGVWVTRGLSDLLFAFQVETPDFEHHERFSEIMGLEKFMKAPLLFHRHAEYEHLQSAEARLKLNKLAQRLGHNFRKMFDELEALGPNDFGRIRTTSFDSYMGDALLDAVTGGYMETRYPVPKPVSDDFPLGGGFYHDPLGSSALTGFVYSVCNASYRLLMQSTDMTPVRSQFAERYGHLESLQRFERLFWEPGCGEQRL